MVIALIVLMFLGGIQYAVAYSAGDDDPNPVRDHWVDVQSGLCANIVTVWYVQAEITAIEGQPETYTDGWGKGTATGCWGVWVEGSPEEEWVINPSYAWCRCTAHFLTSWGNEWWSTAYAWTGVSYD